MELDTDALLSLINKQTFDVIAILSLINKQIFDVIALLSLINQQTFDVIVILSLINQQTFDIIADHSHNVMKATDVHLKTYSYTGEAIETLREAEVIVKYL